MPLTQFSNLDFDQVKEQIKDYLRANSNFTDFDFEGSNFSVLIDILAYNTYISSYNANMLANEVFIDSATLRENIVALARNIGYLPDSKKAAKATVSFFVDTTSLSTNPSTLTLREGLVAVSDQFGGSNFTFCIPKSITSNVVDGIAFFTDVEIYEGTFLRNTFTYNSSLTNQQFIITNTDVDTSTLNIDVKTSEFSNDREYAKYTLIDNIADVDNNSLIYFLNEVADERYEILFGDGIFGKKLEDGNVIRASYIITSGEDANGIRNFTFAGRLFDNLNRVVTTGVSAISLTNESTGGGQIESVESVRSYAPKNYAAQNRAVTTTDYQTIVKRIFPETESSIVFGGEELTPPQYGRVMIGIKPINANYISNFIKNNIESRLKQYSVAGIVPKIIDLSYLFIEIDSEVYYNTNKFSSPDSLKTLVTNTVDQYAKENINSFGSKLKYSKLLCAIDNTNSAITSNITNITMRRDLRPVLNSFAGYEICYGNKMHIQRSELFKIEKFETATQILPGNDGTLTDDNNSSINFTKSSLVKHTNIKSSGFYIDGYAGELYLADNPNADGKTGVINFIRKISETEGSVVRSNAGTIDYERGEIKLGTVNIVRTEKIDGETPIIEISATPESNDVIGLQDIFLQLDISKSSINMVPDTISSGANESGSNYLVSSSYTYRSITR